MRRPALSVFAASGAFGALASLLVTSLLVLPSCRKSASDDGAVPVEPAAETPPPEDTHVALGEASMKHGDRMRNFLFYQPPPPATGERPKLPLVLALHGRLGNGKGQVRLSHFQRIAQREAFMVVFPDGHRRSWHDGRESGPAAEDHIDDVGFLTDLVAMFVRDHGADPSRVYVTGMSNGGFMSGTLACKATTVFAAFAEVAATASKDLESVCAPSAPIPALFIVGDQDPLVPYTGGPIAHDDSGKKGVGISAMTEARFFAKWNACTGESASDLPDTDPSDGTRSSLLMFTGCQADASVQIITVHGGGHGWPGGWAYLPPRFIGNTSRDFDASERIWAFFKDKHR